MKLELEEFLKYQKQFSLGFLTTESFHPLTKKLSDEVNNNLENAIAILKEVDHQALEKLKSYSQKIYQLQQKCQKNLRGKNKIYISGCGATGRLAISIEKLFRDKFNNDQVIGFMAGGDYALIKSVERFEDNFDYGKKQLAELGFGKNDLLLAVTEGGETSFVIGTAEYAANTSSLSPVFIYCNSDEELKNIERSQRVLENSKIEKCNLSVGPMAISGSTRMQATTVQMLAIGFAILHDHTEYANFEKDFHQFINQLLELETGLLSSFITAESQIYQDGELIQYISNDHIALAVLTDTTERSPTFSLNPFEKMGDKENSLCYLTVQDAMSDQVAWEKMLGREIRALDWPEFKGAIASHEILKFDISSNSLKRRNKLSKLHHFKIIDDSHSIIFELGQERIHFELRDHSLFFKHMALKLILNTHSTLVMGKLGRYQGNMMTYVKASNMKLIDRALRYIKELLGEQADEREIITEIFNNIENTKQPMVLNVYEKLREKE